jgi:hypothetical protein
LVFELKWTFAIYREQKMNVSSTQKKGNVDSETSSDDVPIANKKTGNWGGPLTVYPVVTNIPEFIAACKTKTEEEKVKDPAYAKLMELEKDPKFSFTRDKITAYYRDMPTCFKMPRASANAAYKALNDVVNEVTERNQNDVPEFVRATTAFVPHDASAAMRGELAVVVQGCVSNIERDNRQALKPFVKVLKRMRE